MNCMKVAHLQRADQPASNFSALQKGKAGNKPKGNDGYVCGTE